MIDWVEGLAIGWLIVVVIAGTLLVSAGIYVGVIRAVDGGWGDTLSAFSPGMLPPLGLVFALIVGFLVAGLWNDLDNARTAVNQEASALRTADLLTTAAFPAQSPRMKALIRRQIQDAAAKEWPAMANERATLTLVPAPMAQALHLALSLHPAGPAQITAQRELVSSIEAALDARRQRIIVSGSTINWVKWLAIVVLAVLTLIGIACVHCTNRRTTAITMGVFAAAVAITIVLVASQARPFSGHFGIKPDVLLQVQP